MQAKCLCEMTHPGLFTAFEAQGIAAQEKTRLAGPLVLSQRESVLVQTRRLRGLETSWLPPQLPTSNPKP